MHLKTLRLSKKNFMNKKTIAILFPHFGEGGTDVVVAQTIESLKNDYYVTLFTYDNYEKLSKLNDFYSTNILLKDISVINPLLSFLVRKIPSMGLLKYHLLARFFKSRKLKFDVVIGAYKEIDLGMPCIQYIHVPDLNKQDQKSSLTPVVYYKNYLWGRVYKNICYFISGFTEVGMKRNVTIVNSDWTKSIVKKTLDLDSRVIYPPVADRIDNNIFSKRRNSFIYLGRITPVKEIKKIVAIIKEVRSKGFDIDLHIVGVPDILRKNYIKTIEKLCLDNKGWCFLEKPIYGKEKLSFISKYKYGISACKIEAFGIAIAEIIKQGCIAFVPNGGGQVEVVKNNDLIYQDKQDAVEKIIRILNSEKKQNELREYLLLQSQEFSIEKFQYLTNKTVDDFVNEREKKSFKMAIIAPVPFHYHAPLYREINNSLDVDLMVYFCSKETISGKDVEKTYKTIGMLECEDELLRGYKYKFIKNYSPKPSYLRSIFGLANFGIWHEIKVKDYDIVVLQAWNNLTWWIAFFACLKFKTPVFFMTDSNIASELTKGIFTKIIKKIFIGNFLLKKATGFLVSGTANENFYKYYNVRKEKMIRVPFSWGYDKFLNIFKQSKFHKTKIREGLGILKNDFILLYVGRLSKEKSLGVLLKAFKKLNIKNKKLFIVGDGPERAGMEEFIRKNEINGVSFLGFQPHKIISDFYIASDVFVLPSKHETWGIVVNEAMCFGLPIIVSDRVGSGFDLVKNNYNGFVFTSGKVDGLIECVEKIYRMSDEEYANFSNNSVELIEKWVRQANFIEEISKFVNNKLKN